MKSNPIPSKAKRFLFWAGVLITLAAPPVSELILHDSTAAWIFLLCGTFVTLMAKFDELVEFSIGPLKARMRATMQEATATIEQLQKVALSHSKAMLTDLMASSFMGGTTFRNRIDLHDNLILVLKELGIDDSEIKEADAPWRRGMGVVYHRVIYETLEGRTQSNLINPNTPKEVMEVSSQIQKMLDFSRWLAPQPDEIESIIERHGLMTSAVKQIIGDYRHYLDTGVILRKDIFESQKLDIFVSIP